MAIATGTLTTTTLGPYKNPQKPLVTSSQEPAPKDGSTLASRPLAERLGISPAHYSPASGPLFQMQQNSAKQMLTYCKPAPAPKKDEGNIFQQAVNGAAHLVGDGFRAVSSGAGWVAAEAVKNNPVALASRGLAAGADLIGQKDAANFLGGADKASGAVGNAVYGGIRGLGEFEARGIEGVGRLVADPVKEVPQLIRGTTQAVGTTFRALGNVSGNVADAVVSHNPLALASRGLAAGANLIGQKDAANVLGSVDHASGAVGDAIGDGMRTVAHIEAGIIEGAGRVVADPLGAIRGAGTAIGGLAARIHF